MLLHGAIRAAYHEGRMALRPIDRLRDVEVRHESNTEPVVERDLPVLDPIAFGEGLIPGEGLLREHRRLHGRHDARRDPRAGGQLQSAAPPRAGLQGGEVSCSSSATYLTSRQLKGLAGAGSGAPFPRESEYAAALQLSRRQNEEGLLTDSQ
jgi:hypothetical protein